ncbi:MAG: protein kinase [Pseudomonadota bacterium]
MADNSNSTQRWQRLKSLYAHASGLDGAAREDFIRTELADDPELRLELEALLEAESAKTNLTFVGEAITATASQLFDREIQTGARIGAYEIVREIGHGGMGTVWLAARRDESYESSVAIKVMHGLSGHHLRERFLAERQMLANLNHPHIARLLDGGTTSNGAPYVVMEYVEGLPIDAYCEQNALSTSRRIALFCQVCSAVQYAHRNLIVHRDIKPDNILVTPNGEPKLLDFGIAKLIGTRLEEQAVQTVLGQSMLTPQYASPEQVQHGTITTTSDIYSLGVLLNKLLTGRLPYSPDSDELLALAQAIVDDEPVRPSTTHPTCRGDLDNIVLKALRKAPEARYASADDLAADLNRHLERRPVEARPATMLYRLGRFYSRNPIAVSLGILAGVGLVGATLFSTYQMQRAIDAQRVAEAERAIAINEIHRTTLQNAKEALDNRDGASAARLLGRLENDDRHFAWSLMASQLDDSMISLKDSTILATGVRSDGALLALRTDSTLLWHQGAGTADQTYFKTDRLGESKIQAAALSLDAQHAVIARPSQQLEFWQLSRAGPPVLRDTQPLRRKPIDVAVTRDGRRAAILYDNLLEINVGANRERIEIPLPAGGKRITMTGEGNFIGVVFLPTSQTAYHLYAGTGERISRADAYSLHAIALSPNGTQVATSESGNTIRLREAASTRVLERFSGHRKGAPAIVFSADGQRLVVASEDGSLRIHDTRGVTEPTVLLGIQSTPIHVHTDRSGRWIAVQFADGTRLFDSSITRHDHAKGRWLSHQTNSDYIDTLDEFGLLRRYDSSTLALFDQAPIGAMDATTFTRSGDGRYLAMGERGRVLILDALTLEHTDTLTVDDVDVRALSFSHDSQFLSTLTDNGKLTVTDLHSGEHRTLPLSSPIRHARFTPDTFAIIFADSHTLFRQNIGSDQVEHVFERTDATIRSLALTKSGEKLATGWSDGSIEILDAHSLAPVGPFSERMGSVSALAFSPDASLIAAGSSDAELWIWNVATRRPVLNLQPVSDASVVDLYFSSDPRQLVASFADGTVQRFDSRALREQVAHRLAFHQAKNTLREPVAKLFQNQPDAQSVARSLRGDRSFDHIGRRARLALALHPPPIETLPTPGHLSRGALIFAGNDDHVLCAQPQGLAMRSSFTLEMWVWPKPFEYGQTPLDLRMLVNKEGEYQIAVRPDGSLHWTLATEHGWMGWVPTRYRLAHHTWSHLAMVRTPDQIHFYINGVRIQSQPVSSVIGDAHRYKNEFRIGGRQHTPSSFYGRIDEVRVWSQARSERDIQHSLSSALSSNVEGLSAAWSFNEGKGGTARDVTGRHDGHIVGARWTGDHTD